ERAKRSQPYGYLLKPFEDRELHTCIEMALYKHSREKKEKKTQTWLASLVHSIGNCVIATDAEDKVIFLNPTAESLIGWSDHEASGKPISEIFNILNTQTGETLECPTTVALREGIEQRLPTHTVLITRDNKQIPIIDCGSPIKDANGNIIGAVLSFHDFPASSSNGVDYQSIASELLRTNQALAEFASIASHDLKEPLRKIQAFTERLRQNLGPSLDAQGKEYLDRMKQASLRMQKLIDNILEFTRVTTQNQIFEPINLEAVVHEVIHDLQNRLEETQGRVEIMSLPTLEAEPTQMRQLFQNLLSNSLKFYKKGIPPIVIISSRPLESGYWEIRVKDNGIGFEPRELDRLFQPFERLHNRTEYEGTGIGLTICQKIATHHGGTITAESAPRKGTTFILTLPERQAFRDRGPDVSS
nr:PAS domain-containing protein [Nitrospinaceae bacterium]NIR57448.1 PAS domain-containing protein [Nitrospinaceae bacterium]NIS87915.1 PAS domain-containing protein [Nitrospinaceae bacterium]NIT84784.1 PAS domain-containing protein [Nitrospinaceae bacterium]NIU46958.1 PAS domain-containing protein [Nitrospinaceae bacterium]